MKFKQAVIIYNPESSGDAPANARSLQAELQRRAPQLSITLSPTKRAGHGSELAFKAAERYYNPLLISASGDGGYNEVINGALRAQEGGASPICAVLPSGNANDHARTMQAKPLAELIVAGKTSQLDVLKTTLSKDGHPTEVRYVHSYVGLGITPAVAIELDRQTATSVGEALTLLRTFWKLRPVIVRSYGAVAKLDSLVCSNIPEMAKVFTLASEAKPDDGKFELTVLPHNQKIQLFYQIFKGIFASLGAHSQVEGYDCTVLQDTPIQFDGEIMRITKGTRLTVQASPGLLTTLV